jgi:hypothetical protein
LSIEVATTEQNRSRPGFGQPCLIGWKTSEFANFSFENSTNLAPYSDHL